MNLKFEKIKSWSSNKRILSQIFYPKSINEIKNFINSSQSCSTIARGNGRSYGNAAQLKNGTVIKLINSNFKKINLNTTDSNVTVGAGVLLKELIANIVQKGFFLPVTPGTSKITVGGAIASDVHGKNHVKNGSFGDHLINLVILDGNGNLKTLKPNGALNSQNTDQFNATIGGMGLTGVIIEAKIQLRKISNTTMEVYNEKFLNLKDLINKMVINEKEYEYNVAWIDCFDENFRSILSSANHCYKSKFNRNKNYQYKLSRNFILSVPSFLEFRIIYSFMIKLFNKLIFYTSPNKKYTYKNIQDFFYPLDKIDNWNRLYGKEGFMQYQVAIPEGKSHYIFFILDYLRNKKKISYLAVLKRFGKPNNGFLSFPIKGWTLALDIPNHNLREDEIFRLLDEELFKIGARSYMAKDNKKISKNILLKTYPNFNKWQSVKKIMDPRLIFSSDLYQSSII